MRVKDLIVIEDKDAEIVINDIKDFRKVQLEQRMGYTLNHFLRRNKMKEYLDQDYNIKLCLEGENLESLQGWIKVPEGADTLVELLHFKGQFCFFKTQSELSVWNNKENCWGKLNNESIQEYLGDHTVLWERSKVKEKDNRKIKEKDNRVEYFEKFLNGEKLQYRIGSAVGNPDSQWHNLTWNSLKDMKNNLIEFRETPKYVIINGIEFKTTESLLKHVKNNYNLGD